MALLRDPVRRSELADRGRTYGASFWWSVLAERYERLLDQYLPT
jgi:hypothetical protein